MRTLLTKTALSASIMLAMAFTFSCSGDDGNNNGGTSNGSGGGGGVPFNDNSQIYNTDGSLFTGSGVLKFVDKNPPPSINAGSVANGIARLELPTTISNEYLKDFVDKNEQSFCTDYPNDIKVFYASKMYFTLTNSSIDKQMLIQDEVPGNQRIQYWYFSKAGKITCGNIIDINVKEGWNTIYQNASEGTSSTNNILTKQVKWFIEP
jgi:hypothetical protein